MFRDWDMPSNGCMMCFTLSENSPFQTLCCNRQMCVDCIEHLCMTQVEKYQVETSQVMEMPRCPACGYKPRTGNSRMRVSVKRRKRRTVYISTDVHEANDNFILPEKHRFAIRQNFNAANVGFAKCFWRKAIDMWQALGKHHPLLLEWCH